MEAGQTRGGGATPGGCAQEVPHPSHVRSRAGADEGHQQRLEWRRGGAEEAVADAPQSSPAALALGEFYVFTRQPEKAEPELKRAVQLDPKNGPALVGLAGIQAAAKKMDEAEQTYR